MSGRARKLLFLPSDEETAGFYALAEGRSKLCMVVWALEYAKKYVEFFESRCDDGRVRLALESAYLWAKGAIKMPEARRYILAAHKAATECGDAAAEAAARAVAHAASSVHSARHAAGLVLYGLTAVALVYGRDSRQVRQENARLCEGLEKIAAEKKYADKSWAKFLAEK